MKLLSTVIHPSKHYLNMELLLLKKELESNTSLSLKIYHFFLLKLVSNGTAYWIKINKNDMEFLVFCNRTLVQNFNDFASLKKWAFSLSKRS